MKRKRQCVEFTVAGAASAFHWFPV